MRVSTTTHMNCKDSVDYKEAITLIAKAGFDCYDLNMGTLNIDPRNPLGGDNYVNTLNELKDLSEYLGISCNQAHAPYPSQINGNDAYNKKNFEYLLRSMECAAFLGAKVIVIHPIKDHADGQGDRYLSQPYKLFKSSEEKFKANIDFYNRLLPYCKKFNIKVALENLWMRSPNCRTILFPSTCGKAEEFANYLDALDPEWFVGCLDVGHCLLCGENPQDVIRVLGNKRLKALHIHDVSYNEDTHTAPYMMKIEWDEVLEALKEIGYDGDLTFEAHNYFKGFPKEFLSEAVSFLCKIGRYMAEQIL